ncbi:MFS transporter [Streptomyces sp. NPDC059009]|uniref:MFS transporter n=1 Tax=Streptomyces sp. NPDC059009 TaxID=3346694 RepID=UPI0036A897F8
MTAPLNSPRTGSGARLALLAFAQFIITIDYNIVYVALPDIGNAVGFSTQSLQWVVSAYAVAFGGLLLLGGRAVDRMGGRRLFMVGLSCYAVSSLIGGLTTDQGVLLAARAVQGIGGALLFPAVLALIATNFTEGAERNRALAVWGMAGSSGLSAGALLGGVLTDGLGWEWVFYVNVPLAAGAALLAPKLLPADAPQRSGHRGGFDIPGALLVTVGVSALVFGLATGPEVGWSAPRSAGALALGAVLLIAFLLVEGRSRDPLMPLRMLRNRSLVVAMAIIFVFQAALAGGYYFFTTYVQPVLGYSPLKAGIAFLPLTLLSMLGAGKLAAPLIARWGMRATLALALAVNGVGIGATGLGMSVNGSYWAVLPGIVIWGIGGGATFVAAFAAAGSGVAPNEQGVASALASTAQQVGGAVGLAILVAIANSTLVDGGSGPTAASTVDGLRLAGLIAGATLIAGAVLALALKKPAAAGASDVVASSGDAAKDRVPSGR